MLLLAHKVLLAMYRAGCTIIGRLVVAKIIRMLSCCAVQCIAYAIYITPVFFMWEKLIGTHYKPNYIRLPSRLPVGGNPFCSHRTCAGCGLVDAKCIAARDQHCLQHEFEHLQSID